MEQHSDTFYFKWESFWAFLQGTIVLWLSNINWVNFSDDAQTLFKPLLLFVSLLVGIQTLIKNGKKNSSSESK